MSAINFVGQIFQKSDIKNKTKIKTNTSLIDDISYANLIQEHKVYLYKIAFSYVKNEQSALDIIQETTYKGLINISYLKETKYFKTWITRILINVAIDYIRKNKNLLLLDDDAIATTFISNNNLSNNSLSNLADNLDLYASIDNLKENYKTVIILKYFNDMTEKEISQVMGIPVNTVKSNLRRAKFELKKVLN